MGEDKRKRNPEYGKPEEEICKKRVIYAMEYSVM